MTLFTLAIFVAGIWLLSFYADHMLRGDIAHQLGRQQLAATSLLAAQIDDELNERLTALKIVADSISASNLSDPNSIQKMLENRPLFLRDFNAGVYVTQMDGTAIASLPRCSAARVMKRCAATPGCFTDLANDPPNFRNFLPFVGLMT